MKIPAKKYSKIEYVKRVLTDISNYRRCDFCKYSIVNYKQESIGQTMILYFLKSKCSTCINKNVRNRELAKNKDWIRDNFKPLYEWEEENKE